jgi:hypothetical protein
MNKKDTKCMQNRVYCNKNSPPTNSFVDGGLEKHRIAWKTDGTERNLTSELIFVFAAVLNKFPILPKKAIPLT